MSNLPSTLSLALSAPGDVDLTLARGAKKEVALFKAITATDIETFLNGLNKVLDMNSDSSVKIIEEAINLFAYDGFDPEVVYKHFIIMKAELKCKMVELKNDLLLLLTVGHMKGNINGSNIRGLNSGARFAFKKLVERWALALKVDDKKYDITLPRIILAFPREVTYIAKRHTKNYAGPFHSSQLPWYIKTSVFPSLVPAGISTHLYFLVAATLYSCDQTLALRKDKTTAMTAEDRSALFNKQFGYTMIAFNSTVVSEEKRIAFCKDVLEIYNDITKVSTVIKKVKHGQALEKLTDAVIKADTKLIKGGKAAKEREKADGEEADEEEADEEEEEAPV